MSTTEPTTTQPTATPRELRFATYDDIIADVRHLHAVGYDRLGQWSLGVACDHLRLLHKAAIDGFGFYPTWPIRPFFRLVMLPRFEKAGHLPSGVNAPKAFAPRPDVDETESVNAFIAETERIRDHQGRLHHSPLFGKLGHDGWRRVNCVHAAHHLRLLIPRDADGDNSED